MDFGVDMKDISSKGFSSVNLFSEFKKHKDAILYMEKAFQIYYRGIIFYYTPMVKNRKIGLPAYKINLTFSKFRLLPKKEIRVNTQFKDKVISDLFKIVFSEIDNCMNNGCLYSGKEIEFSKPILLSAITENDQDYGVHYNNYGDTSDFEKIGLVAE